MTFEWDEDKNIINKQKHKISFETALHVFDDPDYIEIYDFEHSKDEILQLEEWEIYYLLCLPKEEIIFV